MNTQILLLNPETKKQDTFENIEKIYGPPHANNLLRAQEEDRGLSFAETRAFTIKHNSVKRFLSVKSETDIIDIPVKEHPMNSEPERSTCEEHLPLNIEKYPKKSVEKKTIKSFGIGLPGNFILNPEIMGMLKKTACLYLVLIQERVRNYYHGDKLKIYDKYWKKGIIATSITRPELCRRLGIKSEGTITEYTHSLEENKIIRIEELKRYETFDGQPHNVYILGTHIKKEESFFIDKL